MFDDISNNLQSAENKLKQVYELFNDRKYVKADNLIFEIQAELDKAHNFLTNQIKKDKDNAIK